MADYGLSLRLIDQETGPMTIGMMLTPGSRDVGHPDWADLDEVARQALAGDTAAQSMLCQFAAERWAGGRADDIIAVAVTGENGEFTSF
jgi:hypothetical protein